MLYLTNSENKPPASVCPMLFPTGDTNTPPNRRGIQRHNGRRSLYLLKGTFDHPSLRAMSFDLDVWERSSVAIATLSLAQGQMWREGSLCFHDTTAVDQRCFSAFLCMSCHTGEGSASSCPGDNLCFKRKRTVLYMSCKLSQKYH